MKLVGHSCNRSRLTQHGHGCAKVLEAIATASNLSTKLRFRFATELGQEVKFHDLITGLNCINSIIVLYLTCYSLIHATSLTFYHLRALGRGKVTLTAVFKKATFNSTLSTELSRIIW